MVFGLDGYAYAPTAERILRFDSETGRFVDTFVEGKGGTIVFFPAASSSDLAAVDLQIPSGVMLGADLEITYAVTNYAAPTGAHEWDDVLYLSANDIFDASDEKRRERPAQAAWRVVRATQTRSTCRR